MQSEVKDFQVDQGKRRARRVAAEATVRSIDGFGILAEARAGA